MSKHKFYYGPVILTKMNPREAWGVYAIWHGDTPELLFIFNTESEAALATEMLENEFNI